MGRHLGRVPNLSRRAGSYQPEASQPLAERSRLPDLTRVRVVASYGATIPIVKGKARVPGVVIRVSATHALYALCEGPVAAIRKIYRNDTGQAINDAPGWVPYLGDADQVFPAAAYGMLGISLPFGGYGSDGERSNLRGIACMVGPLEDGRPADVSFEVSTEPAEEAFVRETGVLFGEGASPANWTPQELDANAPTDPLFNRWAEARHLTDFDVAIHDQGGVEIVDAVYFNRQANTISWTRRGSGGTWSTPVNITSTYAPQAGSLPQVKVTSSASWIHVVWSRKSQAVSDVEIAHAWSTNGGSSWSYDTITRPARASETYGAGVRHLSVSEVAGTLWVAFHQWRTALVNSAVGGNRGFTVAAKVGAGAWVYPSTQSGSALGFDRELGIVQGWLTVWAGITQYRSLAPSIQGVDATHARVAWIQHDDSPAQPLAILSAPIKIDTTIKWDVDAAGIFSGVANGAGLKVDWAFANLPTTYLSTTRSAAGPAALEFGATTLTVMGSQFVVGYIEAVGVNLTFSTNVQWGWVLRQYTGTAWGTAWNVPSSSFGGPWNTSVLRPSIRFDGASLLLATARVREAYHTVPPPANWALLYDEVVQYQGETVSALTERLRYRPETASGNDMITRFACGSLREVFTLETSNLDGDSLWENALIRVTPGTALDDALPGDVCRMLLTDRTRGVRLDPALIDADTWGRMDAYHRALGIYISPVVTQQGAAWTLVCEILESVNACPYWSAGLLKVFVRETAVVTNGTDTYTPKPEHAGPIMVINPDHLRGALQINSKALGDRRNILPVSYKDRTRNYTDVPLEHQDQGTLVLLGERRAATVSWPWITRAEVASRCAYLRLLREIRDVRSYRLEVTSAYLQLEPGDIATVSDPANGIGERPMRITRVSESGSWISLEGEPVKVTTVPADTPPAPEPVAFPTLVAPAVNAPIVFNAPASLIGSPTISWEVWALLSWPAAGVGCKCQVSLDNGATWADIGACTEKSPTGWLLAGATDLAVRPDLAVHPFLTVGLFDRLESVDLSESGLAFPAPETWQWDAAAPGALMWLAGELVAYRRLTSGLPDQLKHGMHGTTPAQHPVPARVGAVTSAAFRWTPTPGSGGVQARFRFPSLGSTSYLPQPDADAAQVILTIPAGV